ncbi:hypothetical protein DM02DRAFT_668060 [Periconia macrospinosa]|uniref:Uncharacterized protein n=1 Tax=Periconia macrospinosa TaxID=97972 RepID=A0A2V1E8R1_9PLEO|nr:hypothetical protein DM02DRAFT_668060 [Periconia macrospinosa]
MSLKKPGTKRPANGLSEGSQAEDTPSKRLRMMADEIDRFPTENAKLVAENAKLRAETADLRTKLEAKNQQADRLELKLSRVNGMLAEQELASYKLLDRLRAETQSQDEHEMETIRQQAYSLENKEMIQKLKEELKTLARNVRTMEFDMDDCQRRVEEAEERFAYTEDALEDFDGTIEDMAIRVSAVEDRLHLWDKSGDLRLSRGYLHTRDKENGRNCTSNDKQIIPGHV